MENPSSCLRPLEQVALYVHIPFCRARCSYCDFYSTVDQSFQEPVLARSLRDADEDLGALGDPQLRTVYVGGGTPSMLRPELVRRLLIWIARRTSTGTEITMEANPESLSPRFLALCAEHGVTRISLGIQSLDDGLLRALGRRATAARSRARVSSASARQWLAP